MWINSDTPYFFARTLALWDKLPKGFFTDPYSLYLFSRLKSIVFYPTFPHNMHHFFPLCKPLTSCSNPLSCMAVRSCIKEKKSHFFRDFIFPLKLKPNPNH